MSRTGKLLSGLVAALLAGWLQHGPIGTGEALIGKLETQARELVAATEVPGVGVTFARAPLSRTAVLSGPANEFQRNGMGEMPGLTGMVGSIEGVEAVNWADEPEAGKAAFPLLAEVLVATAIAYLIGVGAGWLLFGRKRRESYL